MGFWKAVASAGPYANNLHLTPDHTNTSSLNFYRPEDNKFDTIRYEMLFESMTYFFSLSLQ